MIDPKSSTNEKNASNNDRTADDKSKLYTNKFGKVPIKYVFRHVHKKGPFPA